MPKKYHCPKCNSEDIIEYEDHLECTQCGFTYSIKTYNGEVDEDNLLAEEDIDGFIDSFEELKDEKTRKRFLKSLEEDFDLKF